LRNFGLFLSKFDCHGNYLGSLENLDSILLDMLTVRIIIIII